jgi:glycine betaine/proline transport system substrate-binding protein
MARGLSRFRYVALAAVVGLGLAACGGSDIEDTSTQAGDCGELRIAINPWTGYVSNAHVIGMVAQNELGCTVTYPEVKEEVGWQGMADGSIDTIVENWGHDDLIAKYIDKQGTVEDAGVTGNEGLIGWFVPQWMADEYPDITDWENLNKYADMFETSESGGKGQLLDGDPSYVTNDEALVKNLGLNYKVVYAGSEQTLIKAFRQAEEKKTPLIGYFFEPQWLHLDIELVKVDLPEYKAGCDADAAKVACDYPRYELDKIASKKFMDKGGPAARLIQNFQWSNDEQDAVASFIAKYKMSPDEAARRWIEANPDRVDDWLTKAKP